MIFSLIIDFIDKIIVNIFKLSILTNRGNITIKNYILWIYVCLMFVRGDYPEDMTTG